LKKLVYVILTMQMNFYKMSIKQRGFCWRVPVLIFLICGYAPPAAAQKANTTDSNAIYLADPTIFQYKKNYYLYGTSGHNANEGFIVYTSTNLKSWEKSTAGNNGYALRKGDVFGTAGFWAPQVFQYHNKFYMAYVANENIAIAESSSPLGPFVQNVKAPLAAPVKQIDPFIFIDTDGKKYLYHVRLTNGNKIFVAEMTDDFLAIKEETLRECITATEGWENTANAEWPVTEGPAVLKHKNLYYLFYTANDFRNPDYATGYAVSSTPYGPWKKFSGNPIVSKRNMGINGTGHGDFVQGKHKELFYVFHTHYSDSAVAPRRTAIVNMGFLKSRNSGADTLRVQPGTFHYLKPKN